LSVNGQRAGPVGDRAERGAIEHVVRHRLFNGD
jgi:hypothetical protein